MSSIKYRAEIDGLRAIAVISVIIFHLNSNWLPGGFLGVDIFFVISGYLITKIIVTEIENKIFTYKNFYNRRIKRIYPIFIFIMFFTSIVGALIFTYNDFNTLRKGIEFSVVLSANIFFAKSQGYFDLDITSNPILHIWSLAVEEQYYLFFPLLVILIYRKSLNKKLLFQAIMILFFLSLASTFIPSSYYTKYINTYYLPQLRFFELLIGSGLSLLSPYKGKGGGNYLIIADLISFICLVLIIYCFFYYSEKTLFVPGIALLIPCFLTAGVIYFSQSGKVIKNILSLSFIVKIGLLSYSLYLWHWVIITIFNYVLGNVSKSILFITLQGVLTFLLSFLGYYLVEKPIRYRKISFWKAFVYIYLIPSILIVGMNYLLRNHIRKIDRQYTKEDSLVIENTLPSKVLMIGDSHADHLSFFLDYVGKKEGWKADIININNMGCKFPIDKNGSIIQSESCLSVMNKIDKYPVIFISFFYDLYSGENPVPRSDPLSYREKNFYLKLQNFVRFLAKDKQVYVFSNIPAISYSPLRILHLKPFGLDKYLPPITSIGDIKSSNDKIYNTINNIPNVHWVDLLSFLPTEYNIDSGPIYKDQDHLTPIGSYNIGYKFSESQILLPKILIEEINSEKR
ncbi:hypothetical protein QV06_09040 [Gallibacterium genomosp. 3]|uniref:Acyltransferase n=1 Tax=Gallibacterium genomosp. 3 TaxID=505345 RepID=A0A1A7PN87_9PAST|nr:acyltransferase family protein [Gallibacterium genomosp. 3]OBX04018.1 hypothetical protein QV06_09040 [Gallibacterium genomosp. 3]